MKPVFLIAVVIVQSMNYAFSVQALSQPNIACVDTRDDCSWIAAHNKDVQAYCNRHWNDAFIKQCRGTCGHCNVPAPQIVISCTDKRADCNWIANNHYDVSKYCWAHRNDALVKGCPKYCGFCAPPAPSVVCEDTRSDCNWIREHTNAAEYCNEYRNDPEVRKCAKTCGFCHYHVHVHPSHYHVPAHATCHDTRDDCSWIAAHNNDVAAYCHRHRNDAFIKQCQGTCGFCHYHVPAHTSHYHVPAHTTCHDTRNDCSWIAAHNNDVAAYCHRHRNDAFIKQCQGTCGFCHYHVPAQPICADTRSDCDTINHIGEPKASYCARNRNDAAVRQCAKTCGFC